MTEHRTGPRSSLFSYALAYLAPWSVAIVGLSLSLAAFWGIQGQISATNLLEFKWVAQNRHRSVNRGIEGGLEAVESVRDFFLVFENLQPSEFSRFARSVLRRSQGIQALAWVAEVEGPDEALSRFQVIHAEPSERNEQPLGCDCVTNSSSMNH